jgi:hypothetical protein
MNQLPAHGLEAAEFARRSWRVNVPGETDLNDMLKPEYWGHVSAKLRTGDLIEAIAADNSFYAEFIVRWSRKLEAGVSLLRHIELEAPALDDNAIEGFEIKHRGSRSMWTILRGKDVVKDKFETENQARAYLQDYVKGLAA